MLFALWEPGLHRVTRDLDLLGFGHPTARTIGGNFQRVVPAGGRSRWR
ncbi:MAG: hypothetical protein V9H26_19760 [Verrucomicrobiota bacterium]